MKSIRGILYIFFFIWLIGTLFSDDKTTTPTRLTDNTPLQQTTKLSTSPPTPRPKPKATTQPQTLAARYVDASRLNVRNGPGKEHKVIWTLKRDEKVQVSRIQGDWSYLIGERYKGWVFSTYLTRNPTPKTTVSKPTKPKKPSLSDTAIKKILIERSLAYYPGNCPCPYNRDRAGRKCGKRSAYIRPGGRSPLCYLEDVSPRMVADYRTRERQ